jgi:hypothetical protein
MSAAEQRYKAVLAVIADSRTVTEVVGTFAGWQPHLVSWGWDLPVMPSSPDDASEHHWKFANRHHAQVFLVALLPLAPRAPRKGDPAPSKNPNSYQFPLLARL